MKQKQLAQAYLDTETTGLDTDAEIIQIGIIDVNGNVLFDSLVKCESEINPMAQEVHGISKEDLINAPTWLEIYQNVSEIIQNHSIINIYNAEFDIRLINQTSKRYGVSFPKFRSHCVMYEFAKEMNWGKRTKLINACDHFYFETDDIKTHSALGDCELTRRLHMAMTRALAPARAEEAKRRKRAKYYRNMVEKKMAFLPKKHWEYPYFGTSRPEGSVAFSSIKLKDMHKYEFLGRACGTYGNQALLMKLKNNDK